MTYDIQGNLLSVTDALGRPEVVRHVYDLANRRLRLESLDAGLRLTVFDAAGQVVEQRDSKGARVLRSYDIANRPILMWARDSSSDSVTLRERLEYGDGSRRDQTAAERNANRVANRLGRLHRHYDEAGLVTVESYDFEANVLTRSRRVIKDTALVAGWKAAWDQPNADNDLDATEYRIDFNYDALQRITLLRYPEDVSGGRKEVRPVYNRAGALQGLTLDGAPYVREIAYNAKGQRTLLVYGNNVLTARVQDTKSFRLQRLWTGHYSAAPGTKHTYVPTKPGKVLQDFAYDYDLVGNIRKLHDRAPGCGVPPVPNALDRIFTYDAIYRLLSASGRECDASSPSPPPWEVSTQCQDWTSTRSYSQYYQYDAVGNLTQIRHSLATGGSPTRDFTFLPDTNRLKHVNVGADRFTYTYDDNGNLISETTSRHFLWDHSDRMTAYRTQPEAGPPSISAAYLYDAGGQRVKKLVRDHGGRTKTTVYLDGIFEHHIHGDTANNLLHIMDDQQRIAQVQVGPALPVDSANSEPVQYHLGDHLGNSTMIVGGGTAADNIFVNREEYTPYGETSFGSYGRKRYRYGGKERDEESGLSYFGFRHYAPWLGRWTSCDPLIINPAGGKTAIARGEAPRTTSGENRDTARASPEAPSKFGDPGNDESDQGVVGDEDSFGVGLYVYANDNPIRFVDHNGLQPTPDQLAQEIQQSADRLTNVLGTAHGLTRGTYEAVIAEGQGAQLTGSGGQTFQHYESMRQAANSLANGQARITQLLNELRRVDPRAAGEVSRVLQPLLQRSREMVTLAQETEQMVVELNASGNAGRLAGVPFNTNRDTANLVSNQLGNMRIGLVPNAIGQSFRDTLEKIRQLPTTLSQLNDRARALGVSVSAGFTALRTAGSAGTSAAVRFFGAAMEFFVGFGSRLTTPFIWIRPEPKGA